MAIAHGCGLTRDFEMDRATKARALISRHSASFSTISESIVSDSICSKAILFGSCFKDDRFWWSATVLPSPSLHSTSHKKRLDRAKEVRHGTAIQQSSSAGSANHDCRAGFGKQEEALNLMVERARFMAHQPGYVSVTLHRSLDGRRIVNCIQWQNHELLKSAHCSPEFRKEWSHFDEVTDEIDPHLYERVEFGDDDNRRS